MRQSIRRTTAATLAIGAILFASSLHRAQAPSASADAVSALDGSRLSATWGRGRLTLETSTASAEHEAALRRLIADQFTGVHADVRFHPAVALPDQWDTLTTRALYWLAATDSATLTVVSDGLQLRAVTHDPDAYTARRKFLRELTPAEYAIDDDVLTAPRGAPLAVTCRKALASLPTQNITFEQSSSTLRSASIGLLDTLAEIAFDCRTMQLGIVGHSDSSGSEAWNLALSRSRAQAVADYLLARGVAAGRLQIIGRGSAEPLTDNATAVGRSRNRRIELQADWPGESLAAAE